MSVTEQRSADAMEAVTSIIDWARALDADRDAALARVKALEAENAALKAGAASGWIGRDQYAFRDDGKVLRVAERAGDCWVTYVFAGKTDDKYVDEGETLAEAKANLDAWGAAPAKAKPRFYAFNDCGGPGVMDGDDIIDRCKDFATAQRIAAALNASEK